MTQDVWWTSPYGARPMSFHNLLKTQKLLK